MGNKYEVSEWYEDKTDGRGLAYHSQCQTEWLCVALWCMWKLKRDGAKCVKLNGVNPPNSVNRWKIFRHIKY